MSDFTNNYLEDEAKSIHSYKVDQMRIAIFK